MAEKRRLQLDLRRVIDEYLAKGWSIAGRDPLVIKRGNVKNKLEDFY